VSSTTPTLSATAVERARQSAEVRVFEPHKIGLPPMGRYFKDMWARRSFANELSRAEMRAAQTNTFFGRLWLVINPLLLAGVYFLLVGILSGAALTPTKFAHLLVTLFAFYFVSNCITGGATSVVKGSKLVMNQAFPRALLPMSAVRTAFRRFAPTLIVTGAVMLLVHVPLGFGTLMAIPSFLIIMVFGAGLSMLFGTLQVYFRDTSAFLPYLVRIWLYLSPVIWTAEDMVGKRFDLPIIKFNPLYPMFVTYNDALILNKISALWLWAAALGWALAAFIAGGLYFISREREFSVRL
jgi:ABC-type polysaccharide/polyol phosphate export permease